VIEEGEFNDEWGTKVKRIDGKRNWSRENSESNCNLTSAVRRGKGKNEDEKGLREG